MARAEPRPGRAREPFLRTRRILRHTMVAATPVSRRLVPLVAIALAFALIGAGTPPPAPATAEAAARSTYRMNLATSSSRRTSSSASGRASR